MNILIDFSQIPINKSGVGTYAVNLVRKISSVNTCLKDIFFILIQDDEKVFNHFSDARFVFIPVNSRIFRYLLLRFFLEQLWIPWLIRKHRIDVVHSLHYSFPLFTFRAKQVVTIHDMTFFLFPEYHLIVKRYYFMFWIKMAALLADRIITVSQSTQNDFCSFARGKKKNITVIPLSSALPDLPDSCMYDFKGIQKKYDLSMEYLLFIGTIEPRKNIHRLLLAFEKLFLDMPDYQLVIVGQRGWKYDKVVSFVENSIAKNHILFTGFVDEMEKRLLLQNAKMFLYLSIYEGFGLPVLEALTYGIPTVTSNVSSMPEIAGEAALKVNPFAVDEIYSAMKLLLTDHDMYHAYSKKALDQAGLFTWEKTAAKTLNVYYSCKDDRKK